MILNEPYLQIGKLNSNNYTLRIIFGMRWWVVTIGNRLIEIILNVWWAVFVSIKIASSKLT
ncbi:MAG: hypothetical protein IH852_16250 [Bacteroidetes bacterium]|nr:hypothetical protein [Bacteroidota bacterium]